MMEKSQCLGGVFQCWICPQEYIVIANRISVHKCRFYGSGPYTGGCISTGGIS